MSEFVGSVSPSVLRKACVTYRSHGNENGVRVKSGGSVASQLSREGAALASLLRKQVTEHCPSERDRMVVRCLLRSVDCAKALCWMTPQPSTAKGARTATN